MPNFIDRRLNPKDKSLGNRQRFLRRAREELKRSIRDQVNAGKIADVDAEHTVAMPVGGTSEPSFQNASDSGRRDHVLPGNKQFAPGDRIPKPGQGGGDRLGPDTAPSPRTISTSCCRARKCSICFSRIWSCPTWSSST